MNVLINHTALAMPTHVLAIPKMKTHSNESTTSEKMSTIMSMSRSEGNNDHVISVYGRRLNDL